MLYSFLLILLIIDGALLAAVVLLQAGTGGGLASMGGGTADMVLGGRQAVTLLHKTSWVTGALFMFLAVLLSIVASQRTVGQTGVQQRLRQQAPVEQPAPAAPLQTVPATGTKKPIVPPPPPPSKKP